MSKNILCCIWTKRIEHPEVEGVPIYEQERWTVSKGMRGQRPNN